MNESLRKEITEYWGVKNEDPALSRVSMATIKLSGKSYADTRVVNGVEEIVERPRYPEDAIGVAKLHYLVSKQTRKELEEKVTAFKNNVGLKGDFAFTAPAVLYDIWENHIIIPSHKKVIEDVSKDHNAQLMDNIEIWWPWVKMFDLILGSPADMEAEELFSAIEELFNIINEEPLKHFIINDIRSTIEDIAQAMDVNIDWENPI